MKVTLFKNFKTVTEPHVVDIDEILKAIKNGKWKDVTESIRHTKDLWYKASDEDSLKMLKNEIAIMKEALPCFIPSGQFTKGVEVEKNGRKYTSYRLDECIEQHSGLFLAEWDFNTRLDALKYRDDLQRDPYIYCAFLSVSGDGVAALVRCTPDIALHPKLYTAFLRRYPNLDPTGRNIGRVRYITYDKDLWINKDAKVWTTVAETKADTTSKIEPQRKGYTDYSKLHLPLEKIRLSEEGEKHYILIRMSNMVGALIRDGFVEEAEGERLLQQEIMKKEGVNKENAFQTIKDGIEHGKTIPTRSAEFKRLSDTPIGLGNNYYKVADVSEEIDNLIENGYERGVTIGYNCCEPLISFRLGYTTYLYAAAAVGKTQFAFQIAVNISMQYGWKWAICSPETGAAHEIYAELASVFAKKSFVNNKGLDLEVKARALDFVHNYFYVIDPKDKSYTVYNFYDEVDAIERETGANIQGTILDPFTEFEWDSSGHRGRIEQYLQQALPFVRKNAAAKHRHHIICTHIANQDIRKVAKEEKWYFPMPTYNDIAGGMEWNKKGFQMIAQWRPLDTNKEPLFNPDTGMPYDKYETIFEVQKTKPKGVGKLGRFSLFYDLMSNNYYELTDFNKRRFAFEKEQAVSLKPNEDFFNENQ
jgi:hypothetical protein